MRDFEPGECGRRGIQKFERWYRSGEFLSNAVVLFVHGAEILRAATRDEPPPTAHCERPVHGVPADRVRSTFVDNTLVPPAVIADRFYENRSDCGFIAALRQHEVKCFPLLQDRAV